MKTKQKLNIFISYAHKDKKFFEVFAEEFKTILKNSQNFEWTIWDDREIPLGTSWDETIKTNIENTDVAVCLLSNSFLASNYIQKEEFENFLEKTKKENFLIIPILFRYCNFDNWSELAKRQFFMPDGEMYGKAHLKDKFSFGTLVEFTKMDYRPIENEYINIYISDFVKKLEQSAKIKFPSKQDVKNTQNQKVKQLNKVPYFNLRNLVGREYHLKTIHQTLQEQNNLMVIYGIGGIGKSTIALAYANHKEYSKDYQHLAWVSISNDIKTDLIQSFMNESSEFKYRTDLDIDKNFDLLINYLKNVQGNNLLIIDNANQFKQLLSIKDDLLRSNWKILITSRSPIKYIYSLPINELSNEHVKELFYKYFQKESDETILNELIEKAGKHTLLVELLAKVGNENPFLENIEELKELFFQKGLNAEDFDLDIQIGNKEDRLFNYMSNLFQTENLTENEIKYLRYFSVLPSIEINIFDLIDFFGIEKKDKMHFANTLNMLVKKGWLQNNQKLYKCHQVTQEILRAKLKPNVENCLIFLKEIKGKIFYHEG